METKTPVALSWLNDPHAVALHVTVQITPAASGSFVTCAVSCCDLVDPQGNSVWHRKTQSLSERRAP